MARPHQDHQRAPLPAKAFIEAPLQCLSTNARRKDRMFCHPRDTLREYYRLGRLGKDVPSCELRDNAITLEPTLR